MDALRPQAGPFPAVSPPTRFPLTPRGLCSGARCLSSAVPLLPRDPGTPAAPRLCDGQGLGIFPLPSGTAPRSTTGNRGRGLTPSAHLVQLAGQRERSASAKRGLQREVSSHIHKYGSARRAGVPENYFLI